MKSSEVRRDAAEPLHAVADPVAAELEAALAMRRTGADAKALRRALRRIEELLDHPEDDRAAALGGARGAI